MPARVAEFVKAAPYARIVLAVSAVAAGVVFLIWHDSELWQALHALPAGAATAIAWILSIAEILAGFALLHPRSARLAAMVLGAFYLFLTLSVLPATIAAPLAKGNYVDFFEKLSIVAGAIAIVASTESDAQRALEFGRIARYMLGVCTVSFAWAQIVYFQYTASLVPTWIGPSQNFWTVLTTVAFALAAIAMLVNVKARLAIRLMALMMALFGVIVWVPAIAAHPATLSNWNEITANYVMTGAAWVVAELATF